MKRLTDWVWAKINSGPKGYFDPVWDEYLRACIDGGHIEIISTIKIEANGVKVWASSHSPTFGHVASDPDGFRRYPSRATRRRLKAIVDEKREAETLECLESLPPLPKAT